MLAAPGDLPLRDDMQEEFDLQRPCAQTALLRGAAHSSSKCSILEKDYSYILQFQLTTVQVRPCHTTPESHLSRACQPTVSAGLRMTVGATTTITTTATSYYYYYHFYY